MTENLLAKRSEIHLMRRVWHIINGILGLGSFYLFDLTPMDCVYVTGVIAIFGFAIDFKRFKSAKLNKTLYKYAGMIMRESEKQSFSGLPFYALGVCLSFLFFSEPIAVLACLFLVFADPIASVVGVYYGKDRLFPNKTLQGTIAAFTTCLVLVLGYAAVFKISSPNIIMFAFFSAIFGALSELLSTLNIDDNLTIPVLSGACMSLLNLWLQVF